MSLTREAILPEIPGLACAALDGHRHSTVGSVGEATPSVLVVQPNGNLSAAIADALRREGFEVCTASDGVAAVYGLRHHWPDAAVLDLDVPGVSGFRLVHLLKEDRAQGPVPVLVLTSLSFDEALDAIHAGADDLLELPCAAEEVVWRMQRLLARPPILPLPAAVRAAERVPSGRPVMATA